MSITRDNIMTLEAYSKYRKEHKPQIMAHRQLRSVHLGDHVNMQFESELTMRYQIQEMLRLEKIFEEEAIQDEINTYAPLVPNGNNWKATMLIEYPDVEERKIALAKLIGIEDKVYIEVEGFKRVYAISDEDLERETDVKTSAVHFCRFEFNEAVKKAIKYGATVKLGCDHPNYDMSAVIPLNKLESLREDLN
jgi:DNA-binding helix-hairpin-helix protein with protein kinase domain